MPFPVPSPTLVLLAAGVGRRFGGDKQLFGLGPDGELLLEYSLFDAANAGFARAVLVVRPDAEEAFRRQLAGTCPEVEIAYAHQAKPLGTGHAVLCAREHVPGPFAVANADDLYGPGSFATLARELKRDDEAWCMVAFPLERTLSPHGPVSRALLKTDAAGRLVSLEEVLEVSEGRALVSMNLWGLRPRAFDVLSEAYAAHTDGEFQLPTAIGDAVAAGGVRVDVLPTDDDWLGVTWPDDRTWVQERLHEAVAAGRYPAPLWSIR